MKLVFLNRVQLVVNVCFRMNPHGFGERNFFSFGRVQRFTQRNVDVDGTFRKLFRYVNCLVYYPVDMPTRISVIIVFGELVGFLCVCSKNILLSNGLPIQLINPLSGSICGEDDYRYLLKKCFRHSRCKIVGSRA